MELVVSTKHTTSVSPFTSANNIALLNFFFRGLLHHFLLYTFSWDPVNSILTQCIIQSHFLTTCKEFQSFCLLCYWLVFLLLVQEYDFVVAQCWYCLCTIVGSMLQRQQSLSNLTKLKVCVVTVLPCPLSLLQGAAIKFCEILCKNIWSAEVASIRMSFIYWARLRAEQATWLPVKSCILQNTTRQTSFLSRWLVADVTYC